MQALIETLGFRHIGIVHDEYAVSADGMKMFGVLDLATEMAGCRFSIGLRNSHDKSMRLAMTCGYRVFVCSNMAFAGDFTPVLAKHSKSFSLIQREQSHGSGTTTLNRDTRGRPSRDCRHGRIDAASSFPRLTHMSPMQYQKQLRLQTARGRMLVDEFCPRELGTREAADLPRSTAKLTERNEYSVSSGCDRKIKTPRLRKMIGSGDTPLND